MRRKKPIIEEWVGSTSPGHRCACSGFPSRWLCLFSFACFILPGHRYACTSRCTAGICSEPGESLRIYYYEYWRSWNMRQLHGDNGTRCSTNLNSKEKKNVRKNKRPSPVEHIDARARLCAQGEPKSRAGRSGLSKSIVFSSFYTKPRVPREDQLLKNWKKISFRATER